jgi:DNA topoisomerase-1
MRTDSLNLSDLFLDEANKYIKENFDKTYTVDTPRKFKNKSKGAQEAHEAIRPTSAMRDPESVKEFLEEKQYKLYKFKKKVKYNNSLKLVCLYFFI